MHIETLTGSGTLTFGEHSQSVSYRIDRYEQNGLGDANGVVSGDAAFLTQAILGRDHCLLTLEDKREAKIIITRMGDADRAEFKVSGPIQ